MTPTKLPLHHHTLRFNHGTLPLGFVLFRKSSFFPPPRSSLRESVDKPFNEHCVLRGRRITASRGRVTAIVPLLLEYVCGGGFRSLKGVGRRRARALSVYQCYQSSSAWLCCVCGPFGHGVKEMLPAGKQCRSDLTTLMMACTPLL